jgi:hypothetical protein
MMNEATRKIGSANSRNCRCQGRTELPSGTSLPRLGSEKIYENLPRVFLRKKPGANHQKPNPTKENRKDAHEAIKS